MNFTDNRNFWNSNSSSPLYFKGDENGTSVYNTDKSVRLAFLRKVYGILSTQLTVTALVCSFVMPLIRDYVVEKYSF